MRFFAVDDRCVEAEGEMVVLFGDKILCKVGGAEELKKKREINKY